jgi:hypothetical protein
LGRNKRVGVVLVLVVVVVVVVVVVGEQWAVDLLRNLRMILSLINCTHNRNRLLPAPVLEPP